MIRYVIRFCPRLIVADVVNAVASSMMSVAGILFFRYIVASIMEANSIYDMLTVSLGMFLINSVYSIVNAHIQSVVIPECMLVLNRIMQSEVFAKAIEMDAACYENTEFYNKFMYAVQQSDTRAVSVLRMVSALVGNIFGISALITLVGTMKPLLLAITLIHVALIFIVNSAATKWQHTLYEETVPYARKSGYAQQVVYQHFYAKDMRLFSGMRDIINGMFIQSVDARIAATKRIGTKIRSLTMLGGLTGQISNITIILYLAFIGVRGAISIADFTLLYGGTQQLASQMMQLLTILPKIYENGMYIENFKTFMDFTPQVHSGVANMPFPQKPVIEMKNVSFVYPGTKKEVLSRVSLQIQSGEKIALVGCNGTGKSTLVKLFTRLYDPSQGVILANGIDYQKFNIDSLRDRMGVVFQDFHILNVSIAENILMRPMEHSHADIAIAEQALRSVGLYEKIASLPRGIHTNISREFDDDGAIFSVGEMQKLAIARIFAKQCDVIFVDEPTSALDPFAENEMMDFLLHVAADKTVIFISHRLSSMQKADRIIYIEEGQVMENGSHAELMQKEGKYARMYYAQARNYQSIQADMFGI